MEKYQVYYDDIFIGKLFVNDEYKYCYEPVFEGVEKVKDRACLLKVMENGTNGEFIIAETSLKNPERSSSVASTTFPFAVSK